MIVCGYSLCCFVFLWVHTVFLMLSFLSFLFFAFLSFLVTRCHSSVLCRGCGREFDMSDIFGSRSLDTFVDSKNSKNPLPFPLCLGASTSSSFCSSHSRFDRAIDYAAMSLSTVKLETALKVSITRHHFSHLSFSSSVHR